MVETRVPSPAPYQPDRSLRDRARQALAAGPRCRPMRFRPNASCCWSRSRRAIERPGMASDLSFWDEFIAVTGRDRKCAIHVLLGPIQPPAPIRRPRRESVWSEFCGTFMAWPSASSAAENAAVSVSAIAIRRHSRAAVTG
jgi:hypothetical protein